MMAGAAQFSERLARRLADTRLAKLASLEAEGKLVKGCKACKPLAQFILEEWRPGSYRPEGAWHNEPRHGSSKGGPCSTSS